MAKCTGRSILSLRDSFLEPENIMIKLGNTSLNGTPMIAVTITDQENNETLMSSHIDVLEVRIDQFENLKSDYIKNNILERKNTKIPLILTIRNDKSEGGKSKISDKVKLSIFEGITPIVDAIDIELSSLVISKVIKIAKKHKKTVIVSSHNLKETPKENILESILKRAIARGANIVKIAAWANSSDDVNQLMQFTLKHKKDNVITMSLGNIGSISRLTFPSVGSLLTYSHLAKPFAPGQLPLDILQQHLRLYYPSYNQYFVKKYEILENT